MQSRFYDFGGDTIIRADQYETTIPPALLSTVPLSKNVADTCASPPIANHKKAGSSPAYRSRPRTGRLAHPVTLSQPYEYKPTRHAPQIEVEFKIHGQGNLHGDGMAIWLTKQRAQTGPVFGSVDQFEGLGVFIDTYKNQRPGVVFPYVMAMVGNGSVSYDKDHDGKDNEIGGCSVRPPKPALFPLNIRSVRNSCIFCDTIHRQ